jgi:hypothetical protein
MSSAAISSTQLTGAKRKIEADTPDPAAVLTVWEKLKRLAIEYDKVIKLDYYEDSYKKLVQIGTRTLPAGDKSNPSKTKSEIRLMKSESEYTSPILRGVPCADEKETIWVTENSIYLTAEASSLPKKAIKRLDESDDEDDE